MHNKRVLVMLSTDSSIFVDGSPARSRMIEYGNLLDEIHIIVFSKKSSGFEVEKLSDRVTAYPTSSWGKSGYITDAFSIGNKLCANLVHNNLAITAQDPFETGMVGVRFSRKYKRPLQIQVHTDFLSPYFNKYGVLNRFRSRIAREVLKQADQIRVVSERIAKSLSLVVDKEKIKVLPVYVDIEFMEKKAGGALPKGKFKKISFIIFMASRLTAEKNYECAISAFAKFHRAFPKAGLVIVGNGPEMAHIEHEALHFGVRNHVFFEGWQKDLVPYFKKAGLLLCTSWYEGYGMVLVEAAVQRVPVVTTDVGIAGEILKNGVNAFVCPVNDSKCLSEKMIELARNNSLREEFKVRLAEDVKSHLFSKKAYYEKHRALFDELFSSNVK